MWLVLWCLYTDTKVDYMWAVWSIFGIAWVLEHLAYQNGVVHGIDLYINMTPEQQGNIKKMFEDAEQ